MWKNQAMSNFALKNWIHIYCITQQTSDDEKPSQPYTGKTVEAKKQQTPNTCVDLKENIKFCMKDNMTPVMVALDGATLPTWWH